MHVQLAAIYDVISAFRSGTFALQETQRRLEGLIFGIRRADRDDDQFFRDCINELEVILFCATPETDRPRAEEVLTRLWAHIQARFGESGDDGSE